MDTQQPETAPQQQQQQKVTVTPEPGSVLDDLLSRHEMAKAAAAEAAVQEKDLRLQIEAALTREHPGAGKFIIAGNQFRPAKTLSWVETVRLNSRRLRDELPETYVQYAEFGGRWELRPARG